MLPDARAPEALNRLRRMAHFRPQACEDIPLRLGAASLDGALGGGLTAGALHDLSPAAPVHLGAATGFALALATIAGRNGKSTLWVQTDFGAHEAGVLYGAGADLFGLAMERLVVMRVARAVDALFATEEALKCGALASVVTELNDDKAADLTATRRLSLAARTGNTPGLLLRHRTASIPSAAATRWEIASAAGTRDAYGGLSPAAFLLSLVKNRRGPCGRWLLQWNHHDRVFSPPDSLGVAAAAFDRPDRTPLVRAG